MSRQQRDRAAQLKDDLVRIAQRGLSHEILPAGSHSFMTWQEDALLALKEAKGSDSIEFLSFVTHIQEILERRYDRSAESPDVIAEHLTAAVSLLSKAAADAEHTKPRTRSYSSPGIIRASLPAREHDMTETHFLLVTALDEERDAVLRHLQLERCPPTTDDVRVYYRGQIDAGRMRYAVALVPLLGMGRVEAANATSDAIRRWRPSYVILVGIAGGIAAKGAALGDVLLADQVVDYELQKKRDGHDEYRFQAHRVDPRLLGEARNLPPGWVAATRVPRPSHGESRVLVGPIATGDKVIVSQEFLEQLRSHFPALVGVEMEAGGAAAASFQAASHPGFFMVRAVSDLADPNKESPVVHAWRNYACDVAATFLARLILAAPVPEATPSPR